MNTDSIKTFSEYKKPYIKRQQLIEKVSPFIGKDIIKIFTGQRRVGKSYMLFQTGDLILEQFPQANIIYINMELAEFGFIHDNSDLIAYVETKITGNRDCLFVDEIQDIEHFEKALRSLLARGGIDIYCTGSNAELLSGDIAGYLSGRSLEIEVYSLTYPEFLSFHQLNESGEAFLKYLRYGGLPYLIHLSLEDHIIFDYLRNIYATILYKDVVNRYKVRNTHFLEQLVKFLADNTGQLFSAKRISEYLKSQRVNISVQVVLNYLNFLTKSYMVFQVGRSDIRGRKIFETGEKYYFENLGLRNSVIGFRQSDISQILENIVFMHLIAKGYKVSVGSLDDFEIDFVAEKHDEKKYFQVTYMMTDEKTTLRETGNLLKIKDNYPKYIISMDELPASNIEGIKQMNIREFLTADGIL
ncbi:MAG TPA: ATP-binding protein [Bacteroidales bacterium]|nr:ATP-binding protein [Bacteroidales bacterium]HPR58598.1 ATP-binding protein [Bacteroidales bacterium]